MHLFIVALQELAARARNEVAGIASRDQLDQLRSAYLGKKGFFADMTTTFAKLAVEEKKTCSGDYNQTKKLLEEIFDQAHKDLDDRLRAAQDEARKLFDVTLVKPELEHRGALHVYTQVIRKIEDVFISMGYQRLDGLEVEDDYHNFGALNIPSDHPAREMYDTLWLTDPGHLLRTHTSTVQIRTMEKQGVPLAGFAPGRVYRHEKVDATHEVMFMQCEGIFIDKGVKFSDLIGTAQTFLRAFFDREDLDIRIRPGYFPFVEPGIEIDMRCIFCTKGCGICKQSTWIEVFPCGMVHPNVLRSVGIDPSIYSGFAMGFGLSRLVMLRHAIKDIRLLTAGKVGFLEQF